MSGQNIEIVKLQIRRGLESQLPILDQGEPAITTDTNKIFVGDGATNHELAHKTDLDATNVQLASMTTKQGDLTQLTTTDKSSIVNALKEIKTQSNLNGTNITTNTNNIGTLSQLNTTDKTSLVNALKEVKSQANSNATAVANIGNASPKGTYATLSALQTASPTGATGIYVVTADGNWYYWSGSAWTAGGIYQSTGLADGSITTSKIEATTATTLGLNSTDMFDCSTSGTNVGNSYYFVLPNKITANTLVSKVTIYANVASSLEICVFHGTGPTLTLDYKFTASVVPGINVIPVNYIPTQDSYMGWHTLTSGGITYVSPAGSWYTNYYQMTVANINVGDTNTFGLTTGANANFNFKVTTVTNNINANANTALNIVNSKIVVPNSTMFDCASSGANVGNSYYFILPNVLPARKTVSSVTIYSNGTSNLEICIFTASGSSFTLKQKFTQAVVAGTNTIPIGYTTGTADYIGFKTGTSGGITYVASYGSWYTSYYQLTIANINVGDINTFPTTTGFAADFNFQITLSDATTFTTIENDIASLKTTVTSPYLTSLDLSTIKRKYQIIPATYGTIGRWFNKTVGGVNCLTTINMGSELYFKVLGTANVTLNFQLVNGSQQSITYSIDHGTFTKALVTSTIPITGLDATKEHLIRIVMDGYAETATNVWTNEEGVAFASATVDAGGSIIGIKPKNKCGLFIGDSITAGLLADTSYASQPLSGSASQNYVAICCQQLGITSLRAAFGVTGILNPGPNTIPNAQVYLDYMTATRPESGDFPDFIVLNHGTNDVLHGQDMVAFQTAYGVYLDRLTSKFGGIPIFAMIPFGQYAATQIRAAAAGRSNVQIVETSTWSLPAALHPTIAESIPLGKSLAAVILNYLGKNFFV